MTIESGRKAKWIYKRIKIFALIYGRNHIQMILNDKIYLFVTVNKKLKINVKINQMHIHCMQMFIHIKTNIQSSSEFQKNIGCQGKFHIM